MITINGREIVGFGFPKEEGEKLAQYILDHQIAFLISSPIEVDLRDCPSKLLISAFFNAFLQRICEVNFQLFELARMINWNLKYQFQRDNVSRWMNEFKESDDEEFESV